MHYSIYLLVTILTAGCTHAHMCAHFVYLNCPISLLHCDMRVYHWCLFTPAYVCGQGFEVGSFSTCPWLALVAGVGGCVLAEAGEEIAVLFYIILYFQGWWVGGRLPSLVYTLTHTHWWMIPLIIWNNNSVLLFQGLCSSNPCRFEFLFLPLGVLPGIETTTLGLTVPRSNQLS